MTKQLVRAALDIAVSLAKWKKRRVDASRKPTEAEETSSAVEYGADIHVNPILSSANLVPTLILITLILTLTL